jgi:hypothetical protein
LASTELLPTKAPGSSSFVRRNPSQHSLFDVDTEIEVLARTVRLLFSSQSLLSPATSSISPLSEFPLTERSYRTPRRF